MNRLLDPINAWWTRNPHATELILLGLSILVSLFGASLRRTLLFPIRYSRTYLSRRSRKLAVRDLQILEKVGDSAFMLVAYLSYYILHELLLNIIGLLTAFPLIAFLITHFFDKRHHGHLFWAAIVIGTFIGNFSGALIRLYFLVQSFFNRDQAIEQLKARIAGR